MSNKTQTVAAYFVWLFETKRDADDAAAAFRDKERASLVSSLFDGDHQLDGLCATDVRVVSVLPYLDRWAVLVFCEWYDEPEAARWEFSPAVFDGEDLPQLDTFTPEGFGARGEAAYWGLVARELGPEPDRVLGMAARLHELTLEAIAATTAAERQRIVEHVASDDLLRAGRISGALTRAQADMPDSPERRELLQLRTVLETAVDKLIGTRGPHAVTFGNLGPELGSADDLARALCDALGYAESAADADEAPLAHRIASWSRTAAAFEAASQRGKA